MSDFYAELSKSLKGKVKKLNDVKPPEYYVPSGDIFLDKLLTGKLVGGGYPAGRLIEIFGEPSHGKTTLAMQAVIGMQNMGGEVLLFDTERAISKERCIAMGVDPNRLLLVQDSTVEDVFASMEEAIITLKKQETPALIVWDSIAGTTTKAEDDADYDKNSMGLHARALSKGFRKLTPLLADSNVVLLAINQRKTDLTNQWNHATLGGKAAAFHSSIRLWVKRVSDFTEKIQDENGVDRENTAGIKTRVTSIKNKITSPNRSTTVFIRHKTGVDPQMSIIEFLVDHKIVTQSGAWCKLDFNGEKLSFYPSKFIEKLETVDGLKDYIDSIIDSYDLVSDVIERKISEEDLQKAKEADPEEISS